MFSDIVDSTRIAEEVGDEEWTGSSAGTASSCVLRSHPAAAKKSARRETGSSPNSPARPTPLLCAIDIQRDVEEVAAAGLGLQLRVGVHAREAVHDDGDLIGRVVNLAARVTGEADPGEILVTEPLADYVGGRLQL